MYRRWKRWNEYFTFIFVRLASSDILTLLAIIDNYGILIRQCVRVYQALEVSMDKIKLWKNVCSDEWTAEKAIIAGNEY